MAESLLLEEAEAMEYHLSTGESCTGPDLPHSPLQSQQQQQQHHHHPVVPLAPPCGLYVDDEDDDHENDDDEESISLSACTSLSGSVDDAGVDGDSVSTTDANGGATTSKVRFLPKDKIATYLEGADMDALAENRAELWYQYEELKNMKRKALSISKEAKRYGLGICLTNTYGKACDETQRALNTWSRNGSSRRGLERWINEEYAAKRSDIRKRTIQSVLRAQAKMKESALNDPEYSTKVLSRLSEAFSVDSRDFARSMGIADALALLEEQPDSPTATTSPSSSSKMMMNKHQVATLGGRPPLQKRSSSSIMAAFSSPSSSNRGKASTSSKSRLGRNLGLTAPLVSADFRQYY